MAKPDKNQSDDSIIEQCAQVPIMSLAELKSILECLLFVSGEPLSGEKLAQIAAVSRSFAEQALKELEEEYCRRGVILRQLAGGWQFVTASEYAPYIEKFYRPRQQALSKAKLETLAIIAYKQPLTRQDIENIRQVNADGMVSSLLERNLIKEVGRRETPGRPILYGTTAEFLNLFGLKSLDELPPISQFAEEMKAVEEQEQVFAEAAEDNKAAKDKSS